MLKDHPKLKTIVILSSSFQKCCKLTLVGRYYRMVYYDDLPSLHLFHADDWSFETIKEGCFKSLFLPLDYYIDLPDSLVLKLADAFQTEMKKKTIKSFFTIQVFICRSNCF